MVSVQALQEDEIDLLTLATRQDAARLGAVLHDEFVEIGRSGRLWSKPEIIRALLDETTHSIPSTSDWSSTALSPTLTLLTYRLTAGDSESRHSSIWDTSGATLTLRFHQGTRIATT